MEKARIYRKGKSVISIYVFIVIIVTVLLIRQLFIFVDLKALTVAFQDTVNKMRIELFVQSAFSLSPNLKYISSTENEGTMEQLNGMMIFTNNMLPLLTFIANTEITSYDYMCEIEPYLSKKEKDENSVEVFNENDKFVAKEGLVETDPVEISALSLEQLTDYDYMMNKMYIVDTNVIATKNLFDVPFFLQEDFKIDVSKEGPKLLVYHTHSQEAFADSKVGDENDTIVGVGDEFVRILEEDYGLETYHLREEFDVVDPKQSYDLIEVRLKQILKENPSIQVCIDLHRDGIPDNMKVVTTINGKPTAKIMFFSGLSKIMKSGVMVDVQSRPNPFLKENMAFSFQMHLMAKELYPDFSRKIYLKANRYNLHNLPRSLLIEIGAQTNTVEEAINAMEPLAKILSKVIQ
ncbi:MAG: stage II sporulation protein P [Vallitaleaceae bacterium]|nr:stage II sporulation protein P [Vallitaleaceae bacterium]